MATQSQPDTKVNPERYFESIGERRSNRAERQPVCVYLETTNRCNLLCTTCPRTYEELEPPADMSWQLFTSIVDQIPNLQIKVASARVGPLGLRAGLLGRGQLFPGHSAHISCVREFLVHLEGGGQRERRVAGSYHLQISM